MSKTKTKKQTERALRALKSKYPNGKAFHISCKRIETHISKGHPPGHGRKP